VSCVPKDFDVVLSLAGVELLFFIAAHMMLCFRLVTNIEIWLLLSSACTASRPPLFPTLPPQEVGSGWAKGWEGTQPGQLT